MLNAFDVGSPHAVLWTVCSLEAGSTLLGWRPQPAWLGELLWTVVQAVILLITIQASAGQMIAKIASINSACAIF